MFRILSVCTALVLGSTPSIASTFNLLYEADFNPLPADLVQWSAISADLDVEITSQSGRVSPALTTFLHQGQEISAPSEFDIHWSGNFSGNVEYDDFEGGTGTVAVNGTIDLRIFYTPSNDRVFFDAGLTGQTATSNAFALNFGLVNLDANDIFNFEAPDFAAPYLIRGQDNILGWEAHLDQNLVGFAAFSDSGTNFVQTTALASVAPSPVPLPAGIWLLIGAAGGLMGLRVLPARGRSRAAA